MIREADWVSKEETFKARLLFSNCNSLFNLLSSTASISRFLVDFASFDISTALEWETSDGLFCFALAFAFAASEFGKGASWFGVWQCEPWVSCQLWSPAPCLNPMKTWIWIDWSWFFVLLAWVWSTNFEVLVYIKGFFLSRDITYSFVIGTFVDKWPVLISLQNLSHSIEWSVWYTVRDRLQGRKRIWVTLFLIKFTIIFFFLFKALTVF